MKVKEGNVEVTKMRKKQLLNMAECASTIFFSVNTCACKTGVMKQYMHTHTS